MAKKDYGNTTRALAYIEAMWAKNHIHLAQEPCGSRSGVASFVSPEGVDSLFPPLNIAMVGDSMSVGCGVSRQEDGLVPDIARELSSYMERDVRWQTFGKLGATMRRVRFRLMTDVHDALEKRPFDSFDILYICAGSNDLMAQRSVIEFTEDLKEVLDMALPLSQKVIVLSPGQLYKSPSLGPHLRRILFYRSEKITEASTHLCTSMEVQYINMTHEDVGTNNAGFYASDNFHPSAYGYSVMAQRIAQMTMTQHNATK
ncbi:SGNH/GDSL hydrolase family protein [Alloscardovia venturai]|uniref:SGNH/GDSL hydrolase family protein n=1 Tax=Alloscardovia venturai TaxID=1769421 RepID=A0ABW2Y694_9BIFI